MRGLLANNKFITFEVLEGDAEDWDSTIRIRTSEGVVMDVVVEDVEVDDDGDQETWLLKKVLQ